MVSSSAFHYARLGQILWVLLVIQCQVTFAQQCTVPASWGNLIVSGDCGGPGAVIPDGASCNLACPTPAAQYTAAGSTAVTCNGGVLTQVQLTCTPVGADGLINSAVWCGDGTSTYIGGYTYRSSSDDCADLATYCDPAGTFQTQANAAASPALTCCNVPGSSNFCGDLPSPARPYVDNACALPVNFGNYVIGDSNLAECFNGFPLFPSSSCFVTCENGPPYDPSTIPTSYSCTAEAELVNAPELFCPSPTQCPISLDFNENVLSGTCTEPFIEQNTFCQVSCAPGYVPESGEDVDNCLPAPPGYPILDQRINLTCKAAPCSLPANFGPNVDPFQCTPGGQLTGDGVGSSCNVGCSPGYTATGDPTYSCSFGDLATATLECTSSAPECPLPPGTVCRNGTLVEGGSCNVACTPGYVPVTPLINSRYTCTNGTAYGAYRCRPSSSCVLPNNFGYQVEAVSCQPGAVLPNGGSCTVRCCNPDNPFLRTQGTYRCINGLLASPILNCRGPEPPSPKRYCKSPYAVQGKPMGLCGTAPVMFLTLCKGVRHNDFAFAYCCGSLCKWHGEPYLHYGEKGYFGYLDKQGKHLGYWHTNGKWSPRYVRSTNSMSEGMDSEDWRGVNPHASVVSLMRSGYRRRPM